MDTQLSFPNKKKVYSQIAVLCFLHGLWGGGGAEKRVCRHLKRILVRTAGAGLESVLVAWCALQRFEGVGEAVAKHRHFAAMAHWTRDEGESSTRLACVEVLNPLPTHTQTQRIKPWPEHTASACLQCTVEVKIINAFVIFFIFFKYCPNYI